MKAPALVIPLLDDRRLASFEAKVEGLTGGVRVDFEAPNHFTTRFHVTNTTPGAQMTDLFAIGQLAENPNVDVTGVCEAPGPGKDLSFVVTVPVTNVANVVLSTLAEPEVPGTPAYFRYKDRCDEWTVAARMEGLEDLQVHRFPGDERMAVGANVTMRQKVKVEVLTRNEGNEDGSLTFVVDRLSTTFVVRADTIFDPTNPIETLGSVFSVRVSNSEQIEHLSVDAGTCLRAHIEKLEVGANQQLALTTSAPGAGGSFIYNCAVDLAAGAIKWLGAAAKEVKGSIEYGAGVAEFRVGSAGDRFLAAWDLDGSLLTRAGERFAFVDATFRSLSIVVRDDDDDRGITVDASQLTRWLGADERLTMQGQPTWTRSASLSPHDVGLPPGTILTLPASLVKPRCNEWNETGGCIGVEDSSEILNRVVPELDGLVGFEGSSAFDLPGRIWRRFL